MWLRPKAPSIKVLSAIQLVLSTYLWVYLFALTMTSDIVFAQVTPRAGEWELSSTFQGPPSGSGKNVQKVCLSVDKLTDMPEQTFMDAAPWPKDMPGKGVPKCTYSDLKRNGLNSTWSLTCEGPRGPMNGGGSAVMQAEHAELANTFEMKGPIGIGTLKLQRSVVARRLGDC